MSDDLHVGQVVIVRDVNERRFGGPRRGEVVKVGRTLVHVKVGRTVEQYRIDTRRKNDKWEHGWIQTEAEHAEEQARRDAMARIKAAGIRFDVGTRRLSIEALLAIAEVVEGDQGATP